MEHVGKRVSKYFPGYGWFDGLVEEVVDVQGVLHARVEYQDGDQEDITFDELEKILAFPDPRAAPRLMVDAPQTRGEFLTAEMGNGLHQRKEKVIDQGEEGRCFLDGNVRIPKRRRSQRGMIVVPLGQGFSIRKLPRMYKRHQWERMSLDQFSFKRPQQQQTSHSNQAAEALRSKESLSHCIDCGTRIRELKAPRRCRMCYQREYRKKRQKLNPAEEHGSLKAHWCLDSATAKAKNNDSPSKRGINKKEVEEQVDQNTVFEQDPPNSATCIINNVMDRRECVEYGSAAVDRDAQTRQYPINDGAPRDSVSRNTASEHCLSERDQTNCMTKLAQDYAPPSDYSVCRVGDQECPYTNEMYNLCVGMQATIQKDWRYFPGKCNPIVYRYIPKTSKVIGHLIQAGLVRLGEKVWYRGGHNRRLAEGWIVWNGIVCGKCSHVMGPTEFEKCAGARVRKPGKHIIFSSQKSLLELTRSMSRLMGTSIKSELPQKALNIEATGNSRPESCG